MKSIRAVVFLVGLVCLCTTILSAQITGELRGTVSDASGGAIAKAAIKLTNLETRQVRTQPVGPEGEFNFALLPVGGYEVQVEAAGFNASRTHADVRTGETASVAFKLVVGTVTEVVDITGAVSRLDLEDAQLQTSISGAAVQELPVNRNANNFVLGVPGVAPVSANNSFLSSGSFNANGGRGRGNNIMVDGITATDVTVTGTGGVTGPLNFSSIREVKIITNNFSAEYGRNSSSQVLYITKSGSNGLHGEAYEYLQNNELNARAFFDRTGAPNILRQNTYGFEAGGPVFIPKLFDGRNKVFWHMDYEGFKKRGTSAPVIANVPTSAQLATVTDPTSLALVKQYQLPTSPTGTLSEVAPNTTNSWETGGRGDFIPGRHDTLWARYAVQDQLANSAGNTFVTSNLPFFGAASTNHPRQASFGETHILSAAAVNEFRFGFGQSKPFFTIQTPYPLGPAISFSDGSVTGLGVANILPQGREQRTYQYTDNFSLTRGRHALKAGFEWYHLEADSVVDSNVRSTLTFANFDAFAKGQLTTYSQSFGNSARSNRVQNAFAFAQDDWKVNRKLTVNLGVRLEFAGGVNEANGRISNLNLDNRASFGAAGAGPLGLLETGKPAFKGNYNWAPRLGFAWQPFGDQKTVVRGGVGYSYDFIFLNPITNQRSLPPLIYTGSLSGVASFTGGNSYASFFAGTADLQKSTAALVGSLNPTTKNFGAISPAIAQNLRNPQIQQRSLGIERDLMHGIVLKATYVGTKATFLQRTRPVNLLANPPAPATSIADQTARLSQFTLANAGLNGNATTFSNRLDPRYNAVNYVESSAASTYNSLQVELQKSFANSSLLRVAYTWAHSLDDVSDVLAVLQNDTSAQQNPNDNHNNHAASTFDLRHTLGVTYVWEIPFLASSGNRLLKGAFGGWSLAGITSYHSGFPINIVAGPTVGGLTDPLQYLGSGNAVDRPNVAGPITNFKPQPAGSAGAPSGTTVVNGVAISNYALSLGLSQPLLGNYGTLGRNALRVNGQMNFDSDIYKNFRFTEKVNVQLRGEFYNIFNQHAFQGVTSANLAAITSPVFGQYNTVSQLSRFGQLGVRIIF